MAAVAPRLGLASLAVGVGLLAVVQWRAATGLQAGATLRRMRQHPEAAAAILEQADRLWPPRREAAYERARLALERGEFETAHDWLERCCDRVASRLRWAQVAANVEYGRGNLEEAERHLSEALALRPTMAVSDWRGLVMLRERIGAPEAAILGARQRAQIHGRQTPPR